MLGDVVVGDVPMVEPPVGGVVVVVPVVLVVPVDGVVVLTPVVVEVLGGIVVLAPGLVVVEEPPALEGTIPGGQGLAATLALVLLLVPGVPTELTEPGVAEPATVLEDVALVEVAGVVAPT